MGKKWIKEKEIIALLKTGKWEMGRSSTFSDNQCWLQEGGIGKGGKVIEVHQNTFWAMFRKDLFKTISERFPVEKFALK